MLRSMTKKQIETSNNKLFGRLVDRLALEFSITFTDAVKAIFSTTAWQQILSLEEPIYYMDETDQYAVIVRELKKGADNNMKVVFTHSENPSREP
jgi:hypothetical protein